METNDVSANPSEEEVGVQKQKKRSVCDAGKGCIEPVPISKLELDTLPHTSVVTRDKDDDEQSEGPVTFPTMRQLKDSVHSHNSTVSSGRKGFSSNITSTAGDTLPQWKYKCNCGELFEKSAELAAHNRWTCKLVEKKFQCHVCKSRFINENGLRRHVKQTHNGNFKCSRCDLCFHNLVKLSRHWMEVHFDDECKSESKLKCFLCGDDSFTCKNDFESHLFMHKYNSNRLNNNRDSEVDMLHKKMLCRKQYTKPETIDLTQDTAEKEACTVSSTGVSSTMEQVTESKLTSNTFLSSAKNSSQYCQQSSLSHTCHSNPHPHHHPRPPPPPRAHPCFPHPPPSHAHQPPPPPHHPPPPPHHSPYAMHHPSHHHHPHHHGYPPSHPHAHKHRHHHSHHPHHHPHHHHPHRKHHLQPHNAMQSPWQQYKHAQLPWDGPPHMFDKKGWMWKRRWKWKKYFKAMMSQYYLPPQFQFAAPPTIAQAASQESASELGQHTDQTRTTVCDFCGLVMDQSKLYAHHAHDCASIFEFTCKVCQKRFKKRHKLLCHMTKKNHFPPDTAANVDHCDTGSTISNLREKLNSVLDLENNPSSYIHDPSASPSTGPILESHLNASLRGSSSLPNCISQYSIPKVCASIPTSASLPNDQQLSHVLHSDSDTDTDTDDDGLAISIRSGSDLTSINEESNSPKSTKLVCSVCFDVCQSTEILAMHLESHVTHVAAIQKVNEWKEKSLQYFPLSSGEDHSISSFADSVTDTSSATGSTLLSIGTSAAEIEKQNNPLEPCSSTTLIVDVNKWREPCKRKNKKQGLGGAGETFSCGICAKDFFNKKTLTRHMRDTHLTKKKEIECPVCFKKFKWIKRGQFYERHLNSHFGVNIFNFKCDICGKTFLEGRKLEAHMALHNQDLRLKCEICGKGYGTKSSLQRHLRVHTGVRPHQCEVCAQAFMEKRELLRHMALHTGTPAFECTVCGQGFTLKTSLHVHMKRKHAAQLEQV